MSIETDLFTMLSGDAGVSALVGTKIHPLTAPQGEAKPFITYQVVANGLHNKLVGAPDSERKVVQINCVSGSYAEAKQTAVAVKSAVYASDGYITSEIDDYFAQVGDYHTNLYRTMLNISIIG